LNLSHEKIITIYLEVRCNSIAVAAIFEVDRSNFKQYPNPETETRL